MIERTTYLEKLKYWKDEQVIKVITGIRRCGKSTLLKQFQENLKRQGVLNEQIIYLNFEELDNENLLDYKSLYEYIKSHLVPQKMNYIFLDEIQNVSQYEKAVDSLYIKDNVDLYITGSNAYMLSSDLSTLLSGRYVEISMLPLSFAEYYEINKKDSKEDSFSDYMKFGGLPYIATMNRTDDKVDTYLEGIYNTVIVKDVEERQKRTQSKKVVDTALLQSISKYLMDVVGNPINDYVDMLTEAFVFYKAERFDIKGKELLKTNAKYYAVDTGIRNHLISKKEFDLGFVLENIVYLELLRRGYKVCIGKVGTKEVDFVAQKNDYKEYIQVSLNLSSEETFNREVSSLREIKDNFDKTILTLDKFTVGNYDGIIVKNVIDWLLN